MKDYDYNLYSEIHRERERAHFKHSKNGDSMESRAWDYPAWLPVLVEEVGEVARELCERRHGQSDRATMDRLRKELIQVAAMSMAWVDSIDSEKEG